MEMNGLATAKSHYYRSGPSPRELLLSAQTLLEGRGLGFQSCKFLVSTFNGESVRCSNKVKRNGSLR
jgi:hypothetical protein